MKKNMLFGSTLSHSLSPEIHEYIYNIIGYDSTYELAEFKENELQKYIEKLSKFDINANVTIPYKEKVLPYLDFLDETAQIIGSVNTIKSENGRLFGYNTDYYGLSETLKHYNISGKAFLILGYGGAAKAVIQYLIDNNAEKVFVATRKKELHRKLIDNEQTKLCENIQAKSYESTQIKSYIDKQIKSYENAQIKSCGISEKIEFISYSDIANISGFGIINTTPIGMHPNIRSCPVSPCVFKNFKFALDLIYMPMRTSFLISAENAGLTGINGLKMLVYQAIKAIEIWTGIEMSISQKSDIFTHFDSKFSVISKIKGDLDLTKNPIFIIGLPGSGKTTLGKSLSKKLDFDFIDLDDYIESKTNMRISEIFLLGESKFRKIEKVSLREVSTAESTVISTGGGVVVTPENRELLSKKPNVIYIDRSCEDILSDVNLQNRPLLKDNPNRIYKIYKERKGYYSSLCDYKIINDGSINDLVENTLKALVSKEEN
ncbi:shikimate kinase [Peptostreptococcus sp. D1]|uniref:shikimate kinase n=1 Tax=Peptostreptococcus sp. D1 TaxID=72304 RepID=UPI0008EF0A4E|nr:shikimate kinase [Peptostreptococcus sp. D1]SFE59063.1 Shikimate 5-dehydrogenase [Peptostreptococcus sp. D1]